ncbi:MAG: hypothetical protein HYV97_16455 [Bdellovibrio sp.]|nr:hypothetical protein [Bdellovibrio sp.]
MKKKFLRAHQMAKGSFSLKNILTDRKVIFNKSLGFSDKISMVHLILPVLLFFVSSSVLAQVQDYCARDIRLNCRLAGTIERDLIYCLKRGSDRLESACFNYVKRYLELHVQPKVTVTPTATPTPAPTPTPTPTPEIPKLIRWNVNPERYQDCLNRWSRMARGYFVLDKEEACSLYAKVYPTEAIKTCVDGALGTRPYTRDYFVNYQSIAQFCESNPGLDAEAQRCIRTKVQNGGDVVAAYNKCDSKIRNCVARMESERPSRGHRAMADLYFDFCFSYPDDPAMSTCISTYAHAKAALISKPKILQSLCDPHVRACVESIKTQLPARHSVDQLETVGKICYRAFQDDLSNVWSECTLRHHLSHQLSQSDAGDLCKISNANARECVLQFVQAHISFPDAVKTCGIQAQHVRDCLFKFYKHQAPFHTAPLNLISATVAEKYCSLETSTEKECFVTGLSSDPARTDEAMQTLATGCRENAASYHKCISDYDEYFDNNYVLNVTKAEGRKICKIPSQEMRICMLNSIMRTSEYVTRPSIFSRGNTWFPYDKYYGICLKNFLGRLLGEMNLGQEWPCRYRYFEEQTIWDKGWTCATDRSRLCQEFTLSLESMTNDQLRPHCSQFRSYYHTAANTYGNPLWHKCQARHLIPER